MAFVDRGTGQRSWRARPRRAVARAAWEFDLAEFTRWYCKQPGLENKAFAALYGDGVECLGTPSRVNSNNDRALATENYALGDGQFQLHIGHNGFAGEPRETWNPCALYLFDSMVAFDPRDPPRLIDAEAVLFDPTLGFVTPSVNIDRTSGTDMAMVVIAGVVVSVMTAGAATAAAASVTSATGSAALGAAAGGAVTGLACSLATGLITGDLSFKSLLVGTLTSALTAGITKAAGFDTAGLDSAGNVVDYGARVIAITGKATLQGALTELAGGTFLDGFTAGVASGFAAEVTRGLNSQITTALKGGQITDVQASMLRTLAQATGSAIGALSDPENAGYAIARDFLSTMLSSPTDTVSASGGSPGDTVVQDDAAELDFTGIVDKTLGATEGGAAGVDDSATSEHDDTGDGRLTEREREGIEQSDEILARRGDELAEANGLNPVLPDGRLQYPDGRILTPGGETITDASPDAGNASAYPSQYRHTNAVAGVAPQGDLIRAPDLPMLAAEFTPILADGRHGTGVPYRDEAGRIFYQTFDADGRSVRLLSTVAAAAPLPLAEMASAIAPAAAIVLNAERTMGPWPLRIAAGATLAGTAWLIAEGTGGIFTREALSPEELSKGQAPLINVPVNPGPAGTPGRVADNRDSSTPGYQSPDSQSTTTLPVTEQSWADLIINQTEGDGSPGPQPGVLSGRRTVIGPREDEDTIRSLTRENESADTLVRHGMNVEQNPAVPGDKNPDFRINGEVFDNIAPVTGNVRNIWSRAEEKVMNGQTPNVVINLRDSSATVDAIAQQFANHSIPGLRTVIVVDQSGNVTILNHNGGN